MDIQLWTLRKKSRIWKTTQRLCSIALLGAMLAGCSGSSDTDPGDGGGVIGTGYTGTASTERSLASNTVEIRSQSGNRTSAEIDGNGKYNASSDTDVSGPYLSRIDLGNNEYLYGIGYEDAQGNVQHNIHDYSNLLIRNWFAERGENIDAAFGSNDSITLPTEQEIAGGINWLTALLELVLADYGVNGNELLTADFISNDTGIDAFLDQNPVLINNGTINIFINQSNSNVQSPAVTDLPLNSDLTEVDSIAPSIPTDVRALAADNNDIVIVWTPSTDNVGVSAYKVFRDGVDIGMTAYPVLTDESQTAGSVFNYTVVAVDAAGNESAPSATASAQTTTEIDTTPPAAPIGLQSNTPSNSSIALTWQHADISDVVSFELNAGVGSARNLFAVTAATFATHAGLDAGIEYCYSVVAVDAAGNKSAPSDELCATTTGSAITTPDPTPTENVLSLDTTSLQVLESSGRVTITVNRSGSEGEVSVDYTIVAGTATSGQDYVGNDGTLTWADGDNAAKSFDIQIASDSVTEDDETFTVTLSNPANATLGANTIATVTITDSAPQACDNEPESLLITTDTTLGLPCYRVSGQLDVRSPANLTIEPGVELRFANGGGIIVREGGSLTAVGSPAQGILFTGLEKTPGYWDDIEFYYSVSGRNQLDYVTIEYGGSASSDPANLSASYATLSVSNSIIRFSDGYGFDFGIGTELSLFSGNSVTSNEISGKTAPITAASIAADNTLTGNTNDYLEVSTQNITEATNWANIGVPWVIDRLDVRAAMTIAAGNELQFNANGEAIVREDGSLKVNGSATAPVIFTGVTKTPGWWEGVQYYYSGSTENEMSYVTIEYAGGDSNAANLTLTGDSRFSADNLTLTNSMGDGFFFSDPSAVSAFTNITSTANQSPGKVTPNLAGAIGSGASFTGNSSDFISVTNSILSSAQTWLTHDVPYLVDGIDVRADLTLSPGSVVVSQTGTEIIVREDGSLNAVGNMAEPIRFTAEFEAAGSWEGIHYYYSIDPQNVLDYVTVEYGGTSDSQGNVMATCNSAALPGVTISNSNLDYSAGWGIYISSSCSVAVGSGVTFLDNAAGEVNVTTP